MDIKFKGKIKKMEDYFGIVTSNDTNKPYFFHISEVVSNDRGNLNEGDVVSYSLKFTKNGNASASDLHLLQRNEMKSKKKNSKSKFQFDDKNDAIIGLRFIKEKLGFQESKLSKFEDKEFVKEEIARIKNIIDDLLEGASPNINDVPIHHINEHQDNNNSSRSHPNYWLYNFNLEIFAEELIDLSKIEVITGKKYDFSIVWHQWKDNKKQIFNAGYNKGHFNYSYVDKGESEQTHVYSSPPPPTRWKLTRIEQKGSAFYISSAPVNEIAQSSYVPSLPPKMKIEETSERILDRDQKPNEWQREVDKNRIRKIQQFIEESDNIIANTPMLFIKESSSASIVGDELIIDYSKFLRIQKSGDALGKYIDRKKRKEKDEAGNIVFDDYRPLWLIDGQHRIKGIHRSELQQGLTVPIIIFPTDFGVHATAKIFAEINTLQKKLNPLHELFMQHRFSIDHINTKRKFRNFRTTSFLDAEMQNWSKDWEHSRANHLSYEIAALLAQKGPLKNRVQFIQQNGNSKDILVSADQWVNYSRDWFYSRCYRYKGEEIEHYINNPLKDDLNLTQRQLFFSEINNYFEAWVDTCNHEEWKINGHSGKWIESSKGKGLIQRKSHFIILLELYNLVKMLAETYKTNHDIPSIVSKETFRKVLSVFKWVDWTDKDLLNTYSGGGEKGRRSLEAWMADALIDGHAHDYKKVHNLDPTIYMSEPGKGICSYLAEPSLDIISVNSWPTKSTPVKLSSCRPFNARSEATWSVFDEDGGNLIIDGRSSVPKYIKPSEAEFIVRYHKEMEYLNKMVVQVEWKNAHARTGKSKLSLQKPI